MVVELSKSHLSTTEARPKSTLWVTPLLVWTSQRCYSAWAAERCPGLPYNLSNRNVNTPLLSWFNLGFIKKASQNISEINYGWGFSNFLKFNIVFSAYHHAIVPLWRWQALSAKIPLFQYSIYFWIIWQTMPALSI